MSRIGTAPIALPKGVEVKVQEQLVAVKGPRGALSMTMHADMAVNQEDGTLTVVRPSDSKEHRSLHGLTRSLINNMVVGVTEGFQKNLEIQGVGFAAEVKGNVLNLKLGFTHGVSFHCPEGIKIVCPKPTQIEISGQDKALVGEIAAVIRGFKPPEPYKGKGIRYKGEYVERKAGKAGKTS